MKKESFRHNQIRWESVSAIIYLVGGALFIWGSVRFFPSLESQAENRGAWIFFAGSLLYLVVTAHDTYEVV
ncbi:MAG: YrhK family protein, partial [Ilumatobacter sp.]|nr:YrhK family protein [Ilumatobacter sp.]